MFIFFNHITTTTTHRYIGIHSTLRNCHRIYHPGIIDPRPLPEVGPGDLDPLGRVGGGNLFPFPSHPGFHLGPPGAGSGFIGGNGPTRPDMQPRFDPFGPPEGNLRPNTNPDHFQPPNFGGDYYM